MTFEWFRKIRTGKRMLSLELSPNKSDPSTYSFTDYKEFD
jgi:hypothetical protein